MSTIKTKETRIGKLPVNIPAKVTVVVEGNVIKVEGPKGKLEKVFSNSVILSKDDNAVYVKPADNSRLARAMQGTARSIISNMVEGVQNPFIKNLEIHGVGFRATLNGNKLDLALGYSHPIVYTIPEGVIVTVTDNTKLKVESADKHLTGQVAADIKHYYKVEPYKKKGVRIVGEFIRSKEGKKTS